MLLNMHSLTDPRYSKIFILIFFPNLELQGLRIKLKSRHEKQKWAEYITVFR